MNSSCTEERRHFAHVWPRCRHCSLAATLRRDVPLLEELPAELQQHLWLIRTILATHPAGNGIRVGIVVGPFVVARIAELRAILRDVLQEQGFTVAHLQVLVTWVSIHDVDEVRSVDAGFLVSVAVLQTERVLSIIPPDAIAAIVNRPLAIFVPANMRPCLTTQAQAEQLLIRTYQAWHDRARC